MILLDDFLYNYHLRVNFVLWFSKGKILPRTLEYLMFLIVSSKFLSIVPCESPISCLGGVLCDGYKIYVMYDVTVVINVLIYSSATQYGCAFVLWGYINIPNLLSVWKTVFVLYCLKCFMILCVVFAIVGVCYQFSFFLKVFYVHFPY
jgi:hypothetical protein